MKGTDGYTVRDSEAITEVQTQKYAGYHVSANRTADKNVKAQCKKMNARLGEAALYGSFKGGLSPALGAHVIVQTVHTVGDYGCILWCPGGGSRSASAKRNMQAIQEVHDRGARVTLGAQRRQAHETPRAVLGQESAALRAERELVRMWGSVRMLNEERHPVAQILYTLLTEVVHGSGGAKRPAFADKMYDAMEGILGNDMARRTVTKAGGAITKAKYKEATRLGYERRCQKAYGDELRRTPSGTALAITKPRFGLAWYLATAASSVKFGRNLTIYRWTQLICGGHNLGSRTGHYTNGKYGCECGHQLQTPQHVLCGGCPRAEDEHERWLTHGGAGVQSMVELLGPTVVYIYRGHSVDRRWMQLNSWMNGQATLIQQTTTGKMQTPQDLVGAILVHVQKALQTTPAYAKTKFLGAENTDKRRDNRGRVGGTDTRARTGGDKRKRGAADEASRGGARAR
jgi:hypothetical protein